MLVMIIAPIALMIAVAHVLTKLGNDSELIVMNAAGMAPWHVFRPFLCLGILVSLVVAWISFYLSPMCLQELRRWATQVRAEIVTSNVQAGRFIVVDGKLTLHIRSREPNGQLLGIMVDDQRDPKERGTIFAERGDLAHQRARHLPAAGERRRSSARSRQAGSGDRPIQGLCVRPVAPVAERRAGDIRHP